MSTGSGHIAKAEWALGEAREATRNTDQKMYLLEAQVHAILALAYATDEGNRT